MNIDLVSQMRFGDVAALRDFLLVHRLVHGELNSAIAQAGLGSTPSVFLDSDNVARAWAARMQGAELTQDEGAALVDWLQRHASLHQAEFDAVRFGIAPDLAVVDFAAPTQFATWMTEHQEIHAAIGAVLGVT